MSRISKIGFGSVRSSVDERGELRETEEISENLAYEAPLSTAFSPQAPQKRAFSAEADPDQALKEAFLAGNDEAFVALYAKYEVSLFYYCKRMLHNEWTAEDAFQDVWTRIFELRNRPDRPEITHFRGLLFQSARNLCWNMLRVDHTGKSIEQDVLEGSELAEIPELTLSEPMTSAASGREIQALMVQALGRLPFDQRETFVLHEYSGFTYAEIAEMMNVPERNVKVRAYRARLRLRKFIQGWLGLGEADDPANYI